MSNKSIICAAITTFFLVPVAQLPAQDDSSSEAPTTIAQQRQEVLEWLEGYVGDEILLRPEDLKSLIEKVRSLSDEEFAKWYRESRRLRAILQSPEWEDTRAWLREFLAVQAMYSDEELEEFRVDIANMAPEDVIKVLERIRRKHQSMIWMRQASERNRQASLSLRNDLMRQQRTPAPSASAAGPARFGPSSKSTAPRRSSYAERRDSYRQNYYIWPGGAGWYRW